MTTPEPATIGEIAYNGYYERTGGMTWNGYAMPLWADLHVNVRFAWEAGAEEVRRHVLKDVIAMLNQAHQEEQQNAVQQLLGEVRQ